MREAPSLKFSPDHFIDHSGIGLNDLYYLGGHIFLNVVRHGDAVVSAFVQRYCGSDCLDETELVNSREDKASFIKSFRTLGGCADAHRRERFSDACKETGFLRQKDSYAS